MMSSTMQMALKRGLAPVRIPEISESTEKKNTVELNKGNNVAFILCLKD